MILFRLATRGKCRGQAPPSLINGGHTPLEKACLGKKSYTGVHLVPNITNFLENLKKKIGPRNFLNFLLIFPDSFINTPNFKVITSKFGSFAPSKINHSFKKMPLWKYPYLRFFIHKFAQTKKRPPRTKFAPQTKISHNWKLPPKIKFAPEI